MAAPPDDDYYSSGGSDGGPPPPDGDGDARYGGWGRAQPGDDRAYADGGDAGYDGPYDDDGGGGGDYYEDGDDYVDYEEPPPPEKPKKKKKGLLRRFVGWLSPRKKAPPPEPSYDEPPPPEPVQDTGPAEVQQMAAGVRVFGAAAVVNSVNTSGAKPKAANPYAAFGLGADDSGSEWSDEEEEEGADGSGGGVEQRFIAATEFQGEKEGYIFKMGDDGLGYYRDGELGGGSVKPLPKQPSGAIAAMFATAAMAPDSDDEHDDHSEDEPPSFEGAQSNPFAATAAKTAKARKPNLPDSTADDEEVEEPPSFAGAVGNPLAAMGSAGFGTGRAMPTRSSPPQRAKRPSGPRPPARPRDAEPQAAEDSAAPQEEEEEGDPPSFEGAVFNPLAPRQSAAKATPRRAPTGAKPPKRPPVSAKPPPRTKLAARPPAHARPPPGVRPPPGAQPPTGEPSHANVETEPEEEPPSFEGAVSNPLAAMAAAAAAKKKKQQKRTAPKPPASRPAATKPSAGSATSSAVAKPARPVGGLAGLMATAALAPDSDSDDWDDSPAVSKAESKAAKVPVKKVTSTAPAVTKPPRPAGGLAGLMATAALAPDSDSDDWDDDVPSVKKAPAVSSSKVQTAADTNGGALAQAAPPSALPHPAKPVNPIAAMMATAALAPDSDSDSEAASDLVPAPTVATQRKQPAAGPPSKPASKPKPPAKPAKAKAPPTKPAGAAKKVAPKQRAAAKPFNPLANMMAAAAQLDSDSEGDTEQAAEAGSTAKKHKPAGQVAALAASFEKSGPILGSAPAESGRSEEFTTHTARPVALEGSAASAVPVVPKEPATMQQQGRTVTGSGKQDTSNPLSALGAVATPKGSKQPGSSAAKQPAGKAPGSRFAKRRPPGRRDTAQTDSGSPAAARQGEPASNARNKTSTSVPKLKPAPSRMREIDMKNAVSAQSSTDGGETPRSRGKRVSEWLAEQRTFEDAFLPPALSLPSRVSAESTPRRTSSAFMFGQNTAPSAITTKYQPHKAADPEIDPEPLVQVPQKSTRSENEGAIGPIETGVVGDDDLAADVAHILRRRRLRTHPAEPGSAGSPIQTSPSGSSREVLARIGHALNSPRSPSTRGTSQPASSSGLSNEVASAATPSYNAFKTRRRDLTLPPHREAVRSAAGAKKEATPRRPAHTPYSQSAVLDAQRRALETAAHNGTPASPFLPHSSEVVRDADDQTVSDTDDESAESDSPVPLGRSGMGARVGITSAAAMRARLAHVAARRGLPTVTPSRPLRPPVSQIVPSTLDNLSTPRDAAPESPRVASVQPDNPTAMPTGWTGQPGTPARRFASDRRYPNHGALVVHGDNAAAATATALRENIVRHAGIAVRGAALSCVAYFVASRAHSVSPQFWTAPPANPLRPSADGSGYDPTRVYLQLVHDKPGAAGGVVQWRDMDSSTVLGSIPLAALTALQLVDGGGFGESREFVLQFGCQEGTSIMVQFECLNTSDAGRWVEALAYLHTLVPLN